jgi:predicted lipoprotein with Yx(FWY)xxD motif
MGRTRSGQVQGLRAGKLVAGGSALLVGILLAACSSGGTKSAATTSSAAKVSVVAKVVALPGHPKILETPSGRTMYYLDSEKAGGDFYCVGHCLSVWPPVVVPAGMTPEVEGASGVKLGVVSRPGVGDQVTLNGRPLYLYEGDSAPGQANGDGLKGPEGTWHVASLMATVGAATSSTTGSYGY